MFSCLLNSKNPDDLVMPSIFLHKLAWYPDYSPWCVQGCSTPSPTSLSLPLCLTSFKPPHPHKSTKSMTLHDITLQHTLQYHPPPTPSPTNPKDTHPHPHCTTLHYTAPHCTTLHHTPGRAMGGRACSTIAILVITRLCMTIGTTMLLLCKHRITTVTGVWPYIMV